MLIASFALARSPRAHETKPQPPPRLKNKLRKVFFIFTTNLLEGVVCLERGRTCRMKIVFNKVTSIETHEHSHGLNRFAVIPTPDRLDADPRFTGRGVTIAFLDSGFYRHPDLTEPINRIASFHDLSGDEDSANADRPIESFHWHGTQTTVAAAGNGHLSDGKYRGVAPDARLVLVKVSRGGRIREEDIASGLRWVIDNRERYNIRVLNISLGGDEDVPCSQSVIDQLAEEAVRSRIVVVVAAGNTTERAPIPPANSPSVITVGG